MSVFTPFTRRFTDERARDIAETREKYDRVRAQWDDTDAKLRYGLEIYRAVNAPDHLNDAVIAAFHDILSLETTVFDFPKWPEPLSLQAQVDLNRFLNAKEHCMAHESRIKRLLVETLTLVLRAIIQQAPKSATPTPFTLPLLNSLSAGFLDKVIMTFWDQELIDNGLFVDLTRTLHFNRCAASGIADPYNPKKPLLLPSNSKTRLAETVAVYFKDTPFIELLNTPVPLQLTYEDRFSHMHVLGGSGSGKTTLLENLILHDLEAEEPPALIVIDSHGDLIPKIAHLKVFEERNLVLIDPRDLDHPPALNIFDITKRMGTYDAVTREQVIAGVIQTFDYLFTGLLGADLTAKQGVFFRYVARLMLALPDTMGRNATILDIIDLMEDAAPYAGAIASLPDIQKRFFQKDFISKAFAQTKEQIRYRLQGILENPTLARLFTSPETKLDLFTEINNGSVVLVDTAKDFLKGASANFGRIFISLVLQAILERAAIPEHKRKPAFLIVDEAASYFDSNIDDLLTEARKYKLGCVFAHQFLDQCTPGLRASFAANTAIKMASGVSSSDARAMAAEMRTTPDFLLNQPRLTFACYVRNVTQQAVSVPVQVGKLTEQPRLSHEDFKHLMALNSARVSLPAPPPPKPSPQPTPASRPEPSPRAKPTSNAADKEW